MRYFAISSDTDTLTGLRLAGIDGALASTKREVLDLVEKVRGDESIAVMLITKPCYDLCSDTIDTIKLSALHPLVSVIPSADGEKGKSGEIRRLVRESIGIKI
jgi:V/A-type H+-transporting ATPase subunit F